MSTEQCSDCKGLHDRHATHKQSEVASRDESDIDMPYLPCVIGQYGANDAFSRRRYLDLVPVPLASCLVVVRTKRCATPMPSRIMGTKLTSGGRRRRVPVASDTAVVSS